MKSYRFARRSFLARWSVDDRAGLPSVTSARGVRGHDGAVAGDALPVKRRLAQPPLPKVKLAFAGEKAGAEQPFGTLEATSLVKVPVVRDEDVANEVGVAEQIERLAA